LVVRAIEPVSSTSPSSPDLFDEAKWRKLKADVSALAEQARAG
jgi:hypothetical protein